MGNHSSRPEHYAYPPHKYRPDKSRSARDRHKENIRYEPSEESYQYPRVYPEPYIQPSYTYSVPPTHGYALPYGYPVQYPAAPPPQPVIPQMPSAQPVYPSMVPPRSHSATPGRMQMPEPVIMPVAEPAPPPSQSAPVIPPLPPPSLMRQPSQTPKRVPVTPGPNAMYQVPVFPDVQTPGSAGVPASFSSSFSEDSESAVIPPLPPGFVTSNSGQSRPRTPYIPQRDEQPRWSRLFPRPRSIQFHHNPLPPPPRSLPSPYIRLIDQLREDPGEFLRRKTVERGGATTLIFVPPVIPATTLPKGGASPAHHHEKKQKGGLFRSISNALGRKSKKRKDEGSYRPFIQQPMVTTGQTVMGYMPAPPLPVIPQSITPQPIVGYTPAPVHAPSTRMPAPEFAGRMPMPSTAASPRMPSPRLGSPRIPSSRPGPSRSASPRLPSPRPASPRAPSPRAISPRPASPAHSHRSHHSHAPRPRILVNLQNELASLVHYSPHPVGYRGILYPSAFHLLEALRFLDGNPEIAEHITRCMSVPEVREVVHQASNFVRPDWEHVVISKMEEVLFEKFTQHRDLLDLLFSTGVAELVYDDKRDDFWGVGSMGDGQNELGKVLMRLRDKLRSGAFRS